MLYYTISEYAELKGISRQAVEDRIRRGTLPIVFKEVKTKRKLIPVKPEDVQALAQGQGVA